MKIFQNGRLNDLIVFDDILTVIPSLLLAGVGALTLWFGGRWFSVIVTDPAASGPLGLLVFFFILVAGTGMFMLAALGVRDNRPDAVTTLLTTIVLYAGYLHFDLLPNTMPVLEHRAALAVASVVPALMIGGTIRYMMTQQVASPTRS